MVKVILALMAALVLALIGWWLIATPAGPAVVAYALLSQAQRQAPAYAVLIVESDREFLASLLARGV